MTPDELAAIYAEAFAGQGRAWRRDEFAELLASPHVILAEDGQAFALGRVIGEEAELLTIATAPAAQRSGLGRRVLGALETALCQRGATRLFLEVAEDNNPARALYAALGFVETGRRTGYYAREGQPPVDALLLEKSLKP